MPSSTDFLNSSDKQEKSRKALLSNRMMRSLLESDPEFPRVVIDGLRWQARMEELLHLFHVEEEVDTDTHEGTSQEHPFA